MTFLGKIFVVLIFVMSLVFMSFAVAVFATHKNWMTVVTDPANGLKKQLTDARSQQSDLENQRAKLETDLANEKAARVRDVGKLTTAKDEIETQRALLADREATLIQNTANAVADNTATQNAIEQLRVEIDALRTSSDIARKERNDALTASVKAEDQLAQAKGEWDRLKKRNEQLVGQVAVLDNRLREAGVQLDSGTPRVEGVVLDSRENGLVEISIGSDDGLAVGHELDVFRFGTDVASSKYLGRVRLVRVEPDKSVGQVIPETRKGTIQRDDRVATRLR